MNTFDEKLIKLMPELEAKMNYHKQKLLGKKSYMSDQVKKVRATKDYPRLVDITDIKVGGIEFRLLHLIVGFSMTYGAHIICIPFTKDIKRRIHVISRVQNYVYEENEVGDYIRVFKNNVKVIKFSHHYIERFNERTHDQVVKFSDPEIAVICDMFSRVDETGKIVNSFKDSRTIAQLCNEDQLKEILEVFSELSGRNVDSILKFINFKEGISIIKTRFGYGIQKITDMGSTLITYLSENMIDDGQRKLFRLFGI